MCVFVSVCVCMPLARTCTSAVNSVLFVGFREFGQEVDYNGMKNYTIFDNELCMLVGQCARLVHVSLVLGKVLCVSSLALYLSKRSLVVWFLFHVDYLSNV